MRPSAATIAQALHKPSAPLGYEVSTAVDTDTRDVGEFTTKLCALELGIDPPALVWFKRRAASTVDPEQGSWLDSAIDGRALPEFHAIVVRADMSLPEVAETSAHECSHLGQWALAQVDERFRSFRAAPDRHERKAENYGLDFRAFFESGNRIHEHDGFAYTSVLRGVAKSGDLLIAEAADGKGLALYRNIGSRARPEWYRVSADPVEC